MTTTTLCHLSVRREQITSARQSMCLIAAHQLLSGKISGDDVAVFKFAKRWHSTFAGTLSADCREILHQPHQLAWAAAEHHHADTKVP